MVAVVRMALVGLDGGRRDVGDNREDHRRHQARDLPVGAHGSGLHRFGWRDYVGGWDVNAGSGLMVAAVTF